MSTIFFALIVLPYLIVMEAWHMFGKGITSKNFWDRVPYIALIILVIILIGLLTNGYRF